MTYGIFCITNTVTGDRYIGSSATIETYLVAIEKELDAGEHISPLLSQHWKIYGSSAFKFEILEKTKPIPAVRYSKLRHWHKQLKPTYNIKSGGSELSGKSGVYRIRLTLTDDCYIGASKDIQHRWKIHQNSLNSKKHHSKKLQAAWNYYGADKFLVELIESTDSLREKERYWFNLCKPTFNSNRP